MPTLRSIAFVNNKGGVGKTTLLCNIAFHLSQSRTRRVLVIDLDPQCNASQLLLSEQQWEDVFGGSSKAARQTIWKVWSNFRRGDSGIDRDYVVHQSERFQVDVLVGHPSMSLMEDGLSNAWQEMSRGELGGLRRSLWLRSLVDTLRGTYEYVLIDAGPSLGALNRTVVLGVGGLVTPAAADLFSVYALDNIRTWLNEWSETLTDGVERARKRFDTDVEDILGDSLGPLQGAAYLGYTVQQYVTKSMQGGERRGTNAYDLYKKQIPDKARALAEATQSQTDHLELGTVPYMFSMVPLAQAAHAPIGTLTPEDGVRGAQFSQQSKYRDQLALLGESVERASARVIGT